MGSERDLQNVNRSTRGVRRRTFVRTAGAIAAGVGAAAYVKPSLTSFEIPEAFAASAPPPPPGPGSFDDSDIEALGCTQITEEFLGLPLIEFEFLQAAQPPGAESVNSVTQQATDCNSADDPTFAAAPAGGGPAPVQPTTKTYDVTGATLKLACQNIFTTTRPMAGNGRRYGG